MMGHEPATATDGMDRLQIDLASTILRIEQAVDLAHDDPLRDLLVDRLRFDADRLRQHLAPETLAWAEQDPHFGATRGQLAAATPPASSWRLVITDSESLDGVAPACPNVDQHLNGDAQADAGPDVHGVFDCCPFPWIEGMGEKDAAALCDLLNAADAWRTMRQGSPTKPKPESAALVDAVDALRAWVRRP